MEPRAHEREKVLGALAHLPIFPLPGAVLLPHGLVPLHIFEPRYRTMMSDCLEGKGVLALAFVTPASFATGEEPPRVLPVVGAGVFDFVEPLPDGRFNLVLRGVTRARIVEELSTDRPYRVVRAVPLPDEQSAAPLDLDSHALALRQMLLQLAQKSPGPGASRMLELLRGVKDPGAVADLAAGALFDDARERQALLEDLSARQRVDLVSAKVAALLVRVGGRAVKGERLN